MILLFCRFVMLHGQPQGILPAAVVSYTVPSDSQMAAHSHVASWAFVLQSPRMYEIIPPPTAPEHTAIHDAAARLEGAVSDLDKTELSKPG